MPSRGWIVAAIVALLALAGCDSRGGGEAAAARSPFRNLGKRADADLGAAHPVPLR